MIAIEDFEQVPITSATELREWLLAHHAQPDSVWVVTYKKSVPDKYVSRWEVLDELLCFGWIDGIRRKLDADRTMQLISPRKAQHWAKTYKDRVAKLTEAGRMHESGLASVALSKASGMWNFMNDVDRLIVPEDLRAALDDMPEAAGFFDALNDSSKRFVLRWLKLTKTDATRRKRISKLVQLSAKGEKLPGS